MSKPQVITETPVSVYDIKEQLESIKKRDGDLTFRGNKVEEYLQQFTMVSPKKAKEIKAKIEELQVPRLKEAHIFKIIDVMPKHLEELKVVLQAYTITVKDEHLKKILDCLI